MNEKLDKAFDELEFAEDIRKANYLATQKEISTGVTDGSDYGLEARITVLEAFVSRLQVRIAKLEDNQ